jgi:hypothetical protein
VAQPAISYREVGRVLFAAEQNKGEVGGAWGYPERSTEEVRYFVELWEPHGQEPTEKLVLHAGAPVEVGHFLAVEDVRYRVTQITHDFGSGQCYVGAMRVKEAERYSP